MFNLLVYPYFSELHIMEQAVIWSLSKRFDEIINIFVYQYSVTYKKGNGKKLEERIRKETKKNIIVHTSPISIIDFENMSGDKGVIDLRRHVNDETKFLAHKNRYENNIPVVVVGKDGRPINFKEIYEPYIAKILEEETLRKQQAEILRKKIVMQQEENLRKQQEEILRKEEEEERRKKMEEEKRRKKEIADKTGNLDYKYFISEENGHFYFYKPINFESFSFTGVSI